MSPQPLGFNAHELAAELARAEDIETGAIDLFSSRFDDLDWSKARAIAQARDELRTAAGETQVGYKLGWTSDVMRKALGISSPNWGTLWDTQVITGELDLQMLRAPLMECELVYRAGAALPVDADRATIECSCDGWAVGLEVVDPRFGTYDFTFLDNTADNSSIARIAVSSFSRTYSDVASFAVEMADGQHRLVGHGRQAMGDPLEAIAWLTRSLATEGLGVAAGDIVFTGGLTPPTEIRRSGWCTARCPALGASVTIEVAA